MGHKSRIHRSRFTGGSKVGGGKTNPTGGRSVSPRPHGRYLRYEDGAVPQTTMSPVERIQYLDSKGFAAVKERRKCSERREIELRKAKSGKKNG